MKQNLEEEELKGLFNELKREDARLASSFAEDWKAALSRRERARHPRRTLSIALATAAVLTLLAGFVFIFLRRSSRPPFQVTSERKPAALIIRSQSTPAPDTEIPLSLSEMPGAGQKQIANRGPLESPGKKRGSNERRPVMRSRPHVLLSQWRSPTEFLLNSPADQLLKTVPRLGESVNEIKAIMPEENN